MATSNFGDRMFLVGETINLGIRVSIPGTRSPQDATVTLTALRLAGVPVTVATTAFTRLAEGDYTLVLPTAGKAPGAYDVVITVSNGPDAVSIVTDRFALKVP